MVQLKVGRQMIQVAISDILYIQAANNYCWLVKKDGEKTLLSLSFGELNEQLSQDHFYPIHRSYLVNLQEIEKIDTLSNQVFLKNCLTVLPLSRYRKATFKRQNILR